MQRFKKDAMDAGAATKFSALDAAKAQTELAKGGLAVKDHGRRPEGRARARRRR